MFSEIVLTAPDVDAQLFKNDLVGPIKNIAKRVTLYASSKDKALNASEKVQQYPRAGDTRDSIVVSLPMESIDVTAVSTDFLGHSYFGDNASVVTDLIPLLRVQTPAQRHLIQAYSQGSPYWKFKK